ncbi:MAG: Shedu anti-phage system protein SduA domain-containing protein [Gammaproteobacteria bacterium]
MHIRSDEETLEEIRRSDPLNEFFVRWDRVWPEDYEKLQNSLNAAEREEDIQQFLQANPQFLIQHLGGGHGRWVIPKQKLGAERVTDFLIAEKHSFGHEWQVVELESPLRPMFNQNGDPSQYLNHAIRQITDWRAWLKANQAYASRPRGESGLGLTDIDSNAKGLILIGRRSDIDAETNARRRQLVQDLNIEIHTFDYLLEALKGRLVALHKQPEEQGREE